MQLEEKLEIHKKKNLYRNRKVISTPQDVELVCDDKKIIAFCSNNYLGLANHPDLILAFQNAAAEFGVGSGASSLINGYSRAHQECEERFAEFLQRDRALFFANGYIANLSILITLTDSKTIVYEDKSNHASLIDGAQCSQAHLRRYAHLDSAHLEKLIAIDNNKNALIVTDGVFSMEGSIAPLPELLKVAKKNKMMLMVDDAHGVGVLGNTGRGTLEIFNLTAQDVPILNCPLGKAFGCYGSLIAGSHELIESLIQFARPYIYSTAPPAALASAATASLQIIKNENWRREKLFSLIEFFKEQAKKRGLNLLNSATPIQMLPIGDVEKSLWASDQLWQRGFLVPAIRPPTVPKNASSLRITLSCLHSEQHIINLLDALVEILNHAHRIVTIHG